MSTMIVGRNGKLLNPVEMHYRLIRTEEAMQESLNELLNMYESIDHEWLEAAVGNLNEAIVDLDILKRSFIDHIVEDREKLNTKPY